MTRYRFNMPVLFEYREQGELRRVYSYYVPPLDNWHSLRCFWLRWHWGWHVRAAKLAARRGKERR